MSDTYILAIDQGTTGTTVLLFDRDCRVRGRAYREVTQHYPQPGWVEHDAREIWEGALAAVGECLQGAGAAAGQVAGIGITNQRETTVVWDRDTGEPLHRAIVWQDRRTAGHCDRLNAGGWTARVQQKTGLVIDAYFSGTKIAWLLDNVPGLRERAARGEVLFGNVDTWLIWKLSGGKTHVTDVSNASRTMIYDITAGAWDQELLQELNIPAAMLPQVRASAERYCETDAQGPLPAGIPVAGDAGDQQAALFGQGCFAAGMAKNTYGTGCFLLTNTGETPIFSQHKLLTTVAWRLNGKTSYALEGSVFSAGATVQWLRDGLKIIKGAAETEELALSVPDNGGVYLVPAFVGLGAPHWDAYARGTILGLTRGATGAHLARAALEAMCYQTKELLDTMALEAGAQLSELRVDGGAAANRFLLQFQADMLGVPVARGASVESTAKGAAMLAGLTVGYWDSPEQAAGSLQAADRFLPQMDAGTRDRLYRGWQKALQRSLAWAE